MIYLRKSIQILFLLFLAVLLSCADNDPQPESQTGCFIRYTNDNRTYSFGCGTDEEYTNADLSNYTFPVKDEGGRPIIWSSSTNYQKVADCADCATNQSVPVSTSSTKPVTRMYPELVFHKKTGMIILNGGQIEPAFAIDLQDVWAYWFDGNVWETLGINKALKNMTVAAMSPAYDEESNRIIFFNGDGETWSYHVEENEWEKMDPGNAPLPRVGQMMTYDSESDRIILFGGFKGTALQDPIYDDTWAYDYNSDTWTEMKPQIHPSPRMYAEMIFNNQSNKVILWGGRIWGHFEDNSIWEYDFDGNTWKEIVVVDGPRLPFPYFGMFYHDQDDEMFLFGGPIDTGKLVQWKYSFGENLWSLLEIDNSPPHREKHGIALHPVLKKVILFGGVADDILLEGTWIFDLETLSWEEL